MRCDGELNKQASPSCVPPSRLTVRLTLLPPTAAIFPLSAPQALERVPSDIRRDGGVARMSDPKMIQEIMAAVSIPVMAKSRIGHLVEAQILQQIGVDYIDE
jgi:hypothetical protein